MTDHTWLTHFPKITYARHKKLAAHFFDSHSFAQTEFDDLCALGLEPEIAHELIIWREKNPWEKIKKHLDDTEIKAISIEDPEYPNLLKQITDPPWVLFVRGQLPSDTNQLAVGVVGTRHPSLYGKEVCIKLSEELAKRKITIVSGLALGIDSFAHQSTLNQNGLTIAVLGAGINRPTIYPRSNENLSERIIKSGGALVSEYPPGTKPTIYSFPARNRIIAGLTQGILIIEAPIQSGALITARRALDYNREVMAVPHAINSLNGAGGNEFIKMGAALVTTAEDICEILSWQNMTV
jgi:DNA processing protein